jgi:rfaE bifunctional protein kinase chain/domain
MPNSEELLAVLDRFARVKVLVVGDVMLDSYWSGTSHRLSPEAPVPVVDLRQSIDIPGGAANVATNIRSAGARVTLAGVIGNDGPGERLCNELERAGLCSEFLIPSESRQTTAKTRVLVQKHQIVRIDDETNDALSEVDENLLLSRVLTVVADTEVIVLSDYAKGCLSAKIISEVTTKARECGKPVIVDPKGRDYSRYRGATMLTPNLSEAMLAANLEHKGDRSICAAGEKLLNEVDAEYVLITLGEHGMKLFRRNGAPVHVPSMARAVYDVTGAGDTVVAFLAASLGTGADYDSAIQIANLAAGLAVEKVGTAIISLNELKSAIADAN